MPGGSSYNGAGKFPTISIKEAKIQCRNCVALGELFRSIVGADMIQRFHMVKTDSNSVYLPKDFISLISCRLIDKYVFVTLTTFTTKESIRNQRRKVSAIVLLVRMPAKISEQSKNELIINVMLKSILEVYSDFQKILKVIAQKSKRITFSKHKIK